MTQIIQDIRPPHRARLALATRCSRRPQQERKRTYYRTLAAAADHEPEGDGQHPSATPLLLTIDEAAGLLRISKWKLYEYIHNRQLRTVKFGSRRLIPAVALQALIDQLGDGGEL